MPASAAAPLNRLPCLLVVAGRDRRLRRSRSDAAFEQGLAVIVDGLAKGGSLSNVEGPKG